MHAGIRAVRHDGFEAGDGQRADANRELVPAGGGGRVPHARRGCVLVPPRAELIGALHPISIRWAHAGQAGDREQPGPGTLTRREKQASFDAWKHACMGESVFYV